MEQRGKVLSTHGTVEAVFLQKVRHNADFRFEVYILFVDLGQMVRYRVQICVALPAESTLQVRDVGLYELRFGEIVKRDLEAERGVFLVHVCPEDVRVVV